RNMEHSLLLGGIIVAVVLLFLLGNVRTAFISLIAIPLSLLTAVILLQKFGITINTITLGGLAIALGEVVDDSIIDVENIFRRLREYHANKSSEPAEAGTAPAPPSPPSPVPERSPSAQVQPRVFDVVLNASLE